jgi:hypothetical protein
MQPTYIPSASYECAQDECFYFPEELYWHEGLGEWLCTDCYDRISEQEGALTPDQVGELTLAKHLTRKAPKLDQTVHPDFQLDAPEEG